MSVEAFTWALSVPIGGNAKVILLGLANHAHPDGTEAYPALDTLAKYAHCDRSTARRNVRKLVEDGWAIEDGNGPKGQTKYRLAMRGGEMPPVAPVPPRGGKSGPEGVAPMPPEPSIEPSKEPSAAQRAHTRAQGAAELPNGFPEDLKPHARQVYAILRDVAGRFGAKEVTPRAVGHAILAAPGRHYVEEAHKMAGWCEGTNRPVKDVAARYQRWLSNADVYAGTEHLGAPIAASAGSNVHRMRPRGGGGTPWSAADMAAIAQRYLDEEAQGTA